MAPYRLIVYLGGGLILLSFYAVWEDSAGSTSGIHLALVAFIAAIGLVLCFVGLMLKSTDRFGSLEEEKAMARHSLAHLESAVELHLCRENGLRANRALGFVLISIGIFMLAIPGLFALIYFSPLSVFAMSLVSFFTTPLFAFGVACLVSGIALRATVPHGNRSVAE